MTRPDASDLGEIPQDRAQGKRSKEDCNTIWGVVTKKILEKGKTCYAQHFRKEFIPGKWTAGAFITE